jgi:hypothetical protein
MGFWALLKDMFPSAAGYTAAGSMLTFVAHRLWNSAWDLSARHARQDAMEKKVGQLSIGMRKLRAKDKRRGLAIALMAKSHEDQKVLLNEIRSLLMSRGTESESTR